MVVASNVLLTWGKGIGQKAEETDENGGLEMRSDTKEGAEQL